MNLKLDRIPEDEEGRVYAEVLRQLWLERKESETKIVIEYDHGYMLEGTGNAYTIRMISNDFMALTQNQWELYPAMGYRRLIDGTIVHKCTKDVREGQQILAEDATIVPPVKVIEERGRGTEIHSTADQGRLLQYWA
jgi:hypothetical protein